MSSKKSEAARVSLRISRSLHKRAVLLAARDNVSLNSWLVESIGLYVGAREAMAATDVIASWPSASTLNLGHDEKPPEPVCPS